MDRRILVLVLVLLVAAGAIWIARWAEPESTGTSQQQSEAPAESAAVPATGEAGAPPARVTEAEPDAAAPAREQVAAPDATTRGPLATIRGRCVDAQHLPLRDISAKLTGWTATSERMDAWLKDHDEPARFEQAITTGEDGRFEFSFWPPPPFQFALELEAAGFAHHTGRWNVLEPGTTKDVGDVVMEPGAKLRGRVVDAAGAPLAKADVSITAVDSRQVDVGPTRHNHAITRDDGSFECWRASAPGDYTIEVWRQQIVKPRSLSWAAGDPAPFLEIVVEERTTRPAMRGIVVDEQGQPVRNAHIEGLQGGGASQTGTDRDGRFVLERGPGVPDEIRLRIDAPGFELLLPEESFTWGREDLEFTLRAGLTVDLLVVRASDQSPVEEYQVRVMPKQLRRVSSYEFEVRARGEHPGGRVQIDRIRRGEHWLAVEPKGDELGSACIPITVADPGPARATVALVATRERTLRVLRSDDSPVVGSRVQLVDPLGHAIDAKVTILPIHAWSRTNDAKAVLVQEGITDAGGELLLRGPSSAEMTVVVRGRGHPDLVVPHVSLDPAEPLVVRVSSGGTLELRIEPLEVLADLRALAGIPARGEVSEEETRFLPAVRLGDVDYRSRRMHPPFQEPAVGFGADGKAVLRGIPPGEWRVMTTLWQRTAQGAQGNSEVLAHVHIVDAKTTSAVLDLAHLRVGQIEGIVLKNGIPTPDANVQLTSTPRARAGGAPSRRHRNLKTDAEGRFSSVVVHGEYMLTLYERSGDGHRALRAEGRVLVTPGATAQRTFDICTGKMHALILDPEGKPVPSVPLELVDVDGDLRHTLPISDADGQTEAELEGHAFRVRVLRKRLLDPTEAQKLFENHQGNKDPFAAHRFELGALTVRPGETTELTLRLPPEWFQ